MSDSVQLTAPCAGWLLRLAAAPDPAFASGLVGDGLVIEPGEDRLCAPCDGEVIAVAATAHAVTLRLANGAELLLHLGIDTVKLHGEGLDLRVAVGSAVRQGDTLIAFDLDRLALAARSLATPMVLVGEGYRFVADAYDREVAPGDAIARIERGAQPASLAAAAMAVAEAERDIVMTLPHGIHARPAAKLAALARRFDATLAVEKGDRRADLRSPVGLMTLGVVNGDRLRLRAAGPEAEAAVDAIAALIAGGMDEAENVPVAAPPPGSAVCASPGLAIGRAVQLSAPRFAIPETSGTPADEARRLVAAIAAIDARLSARGADPIAEAHRALLNDSELTAAADSAIAAGANAAAAWCDATSAAAEALRRSGSALLAERAADLLDLQYQGLAELLGVAPVTTIDMPPDSILLADELLPSQFHALDRSRLAGICTARGGATSHVAILACAAGVPMVVAAGPAVTAIADGTLLLLDADAGQLATAPDDAALAAARQEIDARRTAAAAAVAAAAAPAVTRDGQRVEVFANIGTADDAAEAVTMGAEGCGLLRTEFLFLGRDTAPTADEQAEAYAAVAEALGGRPLILRTLDIGGDKPVPYLPAGNEENPALGVRGIRLSLRHPDLLAAQFEAVLRVAGAGQCRIMLPMIADVAELREARALLAAAQARLGLATSPPLGVMVETPAAALIAEPLAREADFLSIGTNDLTQYALAMDRGAAGLAARADALHPAVLRLIAMTVEGARRHQRWVGVCGGLAADPAATAILVGLGVDELSAVPAAIPALKARIRDLDAAACRALAASALAAGSAAEVRALVAAEGAR